LQATTVSLSTLAAGFQPNQAWLYTGPQWDMHALAQDGHDFMSRALLRFGEANPEAVRNAADPLYKPTPYLQIQQNYGIAGNHGWLVDPDTGAFNLDALRQKAVWNRIGPIAEEDESEFFNNSGHWGKILAYDHELSITLIGLRGPSVTPSMGAALGANPPQTPPGLEGYPSAPPRLTASPRAWITFVGTGLGYLSFYPAWSSPQVPILPTHPGATVQLNATGFRPRMQVALCADAAGGPRYELNTVWSDFGKIQFTVPATAATGFYSVRYYRYFVPGSGYAAWQVVPAGKQPRILVTP
jgi:hypothetical protein